MENNFEKMIAEVISLGAFKANIIEAKDVFLDTSFRDICATNSCGIYGKCWMCPPDIGEINELMEVIRSYTHALVYQTVSPLEDSFDIEGMQAAKKDFSKLVQKVKKAFPDKEMLHLGAGGCGVCKVCSKRDDQPCRHHDLAVASLEGYGVYVSKLAASAGMKYINGQNTVTYFGAVFFRV